MDIFAVIDTNVLVSAMLKKDSVPHKVIEKVFDGTVTAVISEEILTEDGKAMPDPKDVAFYEVTLDARQTREAYLVTGNGRHFPIKPFVVTPAEMLEIIEKNG